MVMPYHLHMPSYFLETFTEYPHLECGTNKKREKVTPLDIKSHFRTVFVLQQLCYTSHKCVTL